MSQPEQGVQGQLQDPQLQGVQPPGVQDVPRQQPLQDPQLQGVQPPGPQPENGDSFNILKEYLLNINNTIVQPVRDFLVANESQTIGDILRARTPDGSAYTLLDLVTWFANLQDLFYNDAHTRHPAAQWNADPVGGFADDFFELLVYAWATIDEKWKNDDDKKWNTCNAIVHNGWTAGRLVTFTNNPTEKVVAFTEQTGNTVVDNILDNNELFQIALQSKGSRKIVRVNVNNDINILVQERRVSQLLPFINITGEEQEKDNIPRKALTYFNLVQPVLMKKFIELAKEIRENYNKKSQAPDFGQAGGKAKGKGAGKGTGKKSAGKGVAGKGTGKKGAGKGAGKSAGKSK